MKKLFYILFLLLFPLSVFAYSNKIMVGGETIGIEVFSDGIYVVGFYDVSGKKIAQEAGFQIGDIIKKVDGDVVRNIDDLNSHFTEEMKYSFEVLRNNTIENISLVLKRDDNLLKTGLYVKDKIKGIGTLSYVDPVTKIYGSLGHEIIENTSFSRFQISNGNIYRAEVSSIKKSIDGSIGEKNASIDKDDIKGSISLNEVVGIFGKYEGDISAEDILEVGSKEEIKRGPAIIRTVLNNEKVEDYDINILSIDESSSTKNILFEIKDSKLLHKTGGIIQGMSGSPIIQNHKIIGVVNYVIIDDVKKGYGIFITSMLEEGDKINS